MKNLILLVLPIIIFSCTKPQEKPLKLSDYPIQPVGIRNVKLTDNFWLPVIKTVQDKTIGYALEKCREEGRLDNFLIAGGKMQGETRGQMPFDDTDVYKIIEGASYSLISSPDEKLEAYLDTLISIIKTGQEPDGYLTTWRTINPEKPPAKWVRPGKRWENLESSHELYNAGHLYEAAVAHYKATGKRNFLDIALKNADLLVNTFGPGKLQKIPGHQIVETGLIKLYRVTQNAKYLHLAKYFLDQRGDSTNHKLNGPYNQDHMPVTQQEEVVGHAVRAVYMYAGMTDIAAIYRDSAYWNATQKLWENMVFKKMYVTGGIGARHEGEAFGDNYELPNLTAYNETCAAIGDVYWNQRMFMLTGNSKYYDVIEQTLYNGLLSGLSLDGVKFFYPNALESDGKYAFNQGACTRKSWFDCSCCPTNLIRFLPAVPGLIYALHADSLFINLYASNHAEIEINYNAISVSQQTDYPWTGDILIAIKPQKTSTFTIKLRIPDWARNEVLPGDLYAFHNHVSQQPVVKINGEKVSVNIKNGYAAITREWKPDDQIALMLPMEVREVIANEKVSDDRNKMALEYGPLVYCVEDVDNHDQVAKLTLGPDLQWSVQKKDDLLHGVNVITGNDEKTTLVAIPYYAWSNRGIGAMKVWLPVKAD